MPRIFDEPAHTQALADADILTFSQNVDLGEDQFAMQVVTGTLGEVKAYCNAGMAPLLSPAFTGNPTVPTQAAANNSTRIANTFYVDRAVANLVNSAPGVLDTLAEISLALNNDPDFADTVLALVSAPRSDASPLVKNAADATKQVRFDLSGITTGQTRLLVPPNYNAALSTLAGVETLLNKLVNGVKLGIGSSDTKLGVAEEIEDFEINSVTPPGSPPSPYFIKLVSLGGVLGATLTMRIPTTSDVVFPVRGTLATTNLVDRIRGPGVKPVSDDTKASATIVDIATMTDSAQLDVTGSADIEKFTLDEDDEKIIKFTGALDLINSTDLEIPGGVDITVAAGDIAIVRGLATAGRSRIVGFVREDGTIVHPYEPLEVVEFPFDA